jgi:protein O-GlcNAc transferase
VADDQLPPETPPPIAAEPVPAPIAPPPPGRIWNKDALEAAARDPAVLVNRASLLYKEQHYGAAAVLCQEVLALSPGHPDALQLLGMTFHAGGDHRMALTLLERAVAVDPYEAVFRNLAVVSLTAMELEKAIAACRHALRLAPDYEAAASQLIFALDLYGAMTPELLLEERRAFNDRFAAELTRSAPPHPNTRDPNRPLRVGYVSGDFHVHSAAIAFGPVLLSHDKRQVRLYLYSTRPHAERDLLTDLFEQQADVWREVADLDDLALADQIRADRIDILVDLAAFSRHGRLMAFARKPAPIQVTGWGYATGTGLDAIDYLVADPITVPPECERFYHEAPIRLPCMLAFDPGQNPPAIGPLPGSENGYVTFGFLGRPAKLNLRTLEVWARILRRVPRSKLIMKGEEYRDSVYRQTIEGYIERAVTWANDPAQLASYRRTLRGKLLGSIVCDHAAYTRTWERKLRDIWRTWCSQQRKAA